MLQYVVLFQGVSSHSMETRWSQDHVRTQATRDSRCVLTLLSVSLKLTTISPEGKSRTITRADAAFLHNLATRDARHHLPHLRQLAKQYFPKTTSAGLVVAINYLVVPPTYNLLPLDEYGRHHKLHSQNSSSNAEARNEALIERARENPGKFTIIQSKIANGFGIQLVLTIVTGGFWDDDDDDENWGGSEDEDGVDGTAGTLKKCDGDDEDDLKNIDGVDIALARMSLNGILRSMGKPEAF